MKKILITLIILLLINTVNAQEDDKTAYLNLEWWKNYKDEILIEHLQNLYEKNYDLKNATLKIKENEKLVKIQFAQELPSLTFDGYYNRDFKSSVQRFGSMAIPSYSQSNFQLPLSVSYEIDIWGKNRLKTKSIKEGLEITKQQERATYISLTSDFCADYFNLIKTQELLKIQNELIKTQNEILSKIKDKKEIGLANIEDVLNEEMILTTLNEEKNNLEDKKEVLINSLRAYLSKTDGEIKTNDFSNIYLLKDLPEQFQCDIIDNRPDFLSQEANIKRLGYDVRIARKELLPKFIIFGQLGINAYNFSDLFKSSTQLANAGILPSFDIFQGGAKVAFLKLKKYEYDEALNNYQKTMVEDIKEVNCALSEFKSAKKNYKEAQDRYNTQNKIYNLSKNKNEIGLNSALDTLYIKEDNLLNEKEKVSSAINYLISTISLYKSTGGKNLYEISNL